MHLLDTDTCIRLVRGDSEVLAKLRGCRRDEVRVSIMTVYELEVGLQKATIDVSQKRKAVDNLLALCPIAPFESKEAIEAAKVRAELEKTGTPIGSIDYLIAGIARANGWTLVTGNLNEFRRVQGLDVEKWHS
ncbi:PIN domain-containing protein [Luteolibacter flavescens]|uniref:Ribonuclease VapC n=1 Tax=Luteolibacter flavescens TaxID=1859460 RepID=A0ABT3FSM3_9BACT|nr:PIN domain-containing protein [Luteolibacter flavescens]MCW1886586.1 PIN domain-containing protein [Luteolibacter flavescens]